MKSDESTMVYNIPAVSELNKVSNFDPLKYLRKTENGMELPLKFKKLWFRLKYPQGRVRISNIRITDQLAIIEARVFFDRKDTESVANYTATCDIKSAPDGQYIQMAQYLATDKALNDAGFGIQFISADSEIKPTDAVNLATVQKPKIEEAKSIPAASAPVVEKAKIAQPVVDKISTVAKTPAIQSAVANETDYKEIIVDEPAKTAVESNPIVVEPSVASESVAEKVIQTTTPLVTQAVPAPSFTIIDEKEAVDKDSVSTYTKEMSVEDICAVMSLEEAENYVVKSGACSGMKLSQVADRRPASLRFYMNGYKGDDNILRAASTLIVTAHPELLAS